MDVRIRLHRGSYQESRSTEETIDGTEAQVREYLQRYLNEHTYKPTHRISVKLYSANPHHGWDRHYIVTLNHHAVAFMSHDLQTTIPS